MSEISWRSLCELLGGEEGSLSYMNLHVTFLFKDVHLTFFALYEALRVSGEAGLSSKYVKNNRGVWD